MLDILFGFNARIGRLKYFLLTIAFGVVSGILFTPIAYYAYKHGMLDWVNERATPKSIWSMGWPVVSFVVFSMAGYFMLAAMRFRDIGWDPILMVSGWIAVTALDPVLASRVPAMALEKHDGTVIGGLINLILTVILLFWPGSEYVPSPPVFDKPAPPRASSTSTVSSERIARATQFGRR